LSPFISFDIVSYAAGIGQLPATIIYSYIGSVLIGTTKTIVMGLLLLFAISILIFLFKKVWNDKKQLKDIIDVKDIN